MGQIRISGSLSSSLTRSLLSILVTDTKIGFKAKVFQVSHAGKKYKRQKLLRHHLRRQQQRPSLHIFWSDQLCPEWKPVFKECSFKIIPGSLIGFLKYFFLNISYPGLLFFIFIFSTEQMVDKIFPMSAFEPRISGIVSDCSTNWATTTAHFFVKLDSTCKAVSYRDAFCRICDSIKRSADLNNCPGRGQTWHLFLS